MTLTHVSDRSIPEKQDGNQGSRSTPPIPMAGSEAEQTASPQLDDSNTDRLRRSRCSSVDGKNLHPKYSHYIRLLSLYLKRTAEIFTCNAPRPHHNILPSSISGAHKDIKFAPSAHQSKVDTWDEKEVETDDKREGSNTNTRRRA